MPRVLVVDDDSWQAEHLVEQLVAAGYEAEATLHAPQAIANIDSSMPDCVVLDIGLPGVNGMALLHELRSHTDLAKVPVVVCTNVAVELDELRPYGVKAVLQKAGINHGDIVAAVRRVGL